MLNPDWPIGVFDSGMGGLTVLQALKTLLPSEHYIYLGDTARLPYGTKSAETITSYALRAAELIQKHQIKLLVVACNTASSVALPALQAQLSPIPVIGVVTPGAKAAVMTSQSRHIGVLATESTVRFNAYTQAVQLIDPLAKISQWPCSFLVPLVEEGWIEGPLVEQILTKLLAPCLAEIQQSNIDTILLGCTHFPILKAPLQTVLGEKITLVDSALTTAEAVKVELAARNLLKNTAEPGAFRIMATDKLTRFSQVAAVFMGEDADKEVEWVSF
jgi:glutamate racemase